MKKINKLDILFFVIAALSVVFIALAIVGLSLNDNVLTSLGFLGLLFFYFTYHFFADFCDIFERKENLNDKE